MRSTELQCRRGHCLTLASFRDSATHASAGSELSTCAHLVNGEPSTHPSPLLHSPQEPAHSRPITCPAGFILPGSSQPWELWTALVATRATSPFSNAELRGEIRRSQTTTRMDDTDATSGAPSLPQFYTMCTEGVLHTYRVMWDGVSKREGDEGRRK